MMDQNGPSCQPKLVLFDLDNTLCDHRSSLYIRLDHAFRSSLPDPDQRAALVAASAGIAHDGTEHFSELFANHDLHEPEAVQVAKSRYQSDRYRGLELFGDALEAIAAVGERYEIAMITNGPTDIQQPKLDLLGIEPLFSFVLISESTGFWKPDPRIFELALERAGVAAHEAVYVGDSPENDVKGAQSAGLSAIWMNRWHEDWPGGREPDHAVKNLDEVLRWLKL